MPPANINNPFLELKVRSLVLGSLIILFSLIGGVGLVGRLSSIDLTDPIIFHIIYILFFGLLCFGVLWRLDHLQINPRFIVGRLPSGRRWLPTAGLVIAAFLFSMSAFLLSFSLLSFFAPDFVETVLKEDTFETSSKAAHPILYNLLMGASLVIVAPVVEEFIFRGILLQRWAVKWGIRPALVISSLVFGVLHLNVVGLSMFGLVMGLLYIKTRTLLLPMICHAFNNALAVILGFLPDDLNGAESTNTLEQFRSSWWVGGLLLILSAPWLFQFISRSWPQRQADVPYFVNASRWSSEDDAKDG